MYRGITNFGWLAGGVYLFTGARGNYRYGCGQAKAKPGEVLIYPLQLSQDLQPNHLNSGIAYIQDLKFVIANDDAFF